MEVGDTPTPPGGDSSSSTSAASSPTGRAARSRRRCDPLRRPATVRPRALGQGRRHPQLRDPVSLPHRPPGFHLLVRGPLNDPRDGIAALETLVEADGAASPFLMHWQFTHPGSVVFEQDEPICQIVPQGLRRPLPLPVGGAPGRPATESEWRRLAAGTASRVREYLATHVRTRSRPAARARPARGRPTSARARSRAGTWRAPGSRRAARGAWREVISRRSRSPQAIVVGHGHRRRRPARDRRQRRVEARGRARSRGSCARRPSAGRRHGRATIRPASSVRRTGPP